LPVNVQNASSSLIFRSGGDPARLQNFTQRSQLCVAHRRARKRQKIAHHVPVLYMTLSGLRVDRKNILRQRT
jgi:hypothetical protein